MPINDHDNDSTHIWLRQSARFTVGDQRRTIEIAIPVRPGATAAEIEQLLREADAGMGQVTAHLNTQIASITGAPSVDEAASAASLPATAATAPAATASDARQDAAAREDARAAAPAPTRVRETPEPAEPPAASQATPPTRAAATPPPPPAPRSSAAPPPATPSPAADAPPMTIPEFLTETRALGLQPPQAMERLGVRSLQGLNLREALESLRRGAPQDAGHTTHPAADATRSAPAAASASARVTSAPPASPAPGPATTARHDTPPAPVTRFDEEDDDADYDVTFSLGDDADMDDFAAGSPAEGYSAGDDADDDDAGGTRLDDVPDFDAPAPPAPAPTVGARRRTPAAGAPASAADATSAPTSLPLRARAATLIEQFRATLPGGAALPHQLTAYTNLLVGQLDETRASALVRGLWRTAPERLGTEQLHALIRWAKEDDFAEEAPAVLAALAAERTRGAGSARSSDNAGSASAPRAAPARAARPSGGGASARPTSRGGGH